MESIKILKKNADTDSLYSWVLELLPESIKYALNKTDPTLLNGLSEIRLRANGVSCVSVLGKNFVISENGIFPHSEKCISLDFRDLDDFLHKVCRGSVYSHESSIANGFITVNGARMGLSGDVTLKNGNVAGFSSIRSINIRFPRHINGCADILLKHIRERSSDSLGGILIASAPGVGKTTVLRELAVKLSESIKDPYGNNRMYRVSVVDERCELYIPALFKRCTADVYSGIPKHIGIEFASRTMNPEIIIFDELGSEADARAVMSSHFGGSAFITSVHAGCLDDVKRKKVLRTLFDERIFTHIYFLNRTDSGINGTLYEVDKC